MSADREADEPSGAERPSAQAAAAVPSVPVDDEALLVHARALDDLRMAQTDLARELAQGREVREGLDELGGALSELASGQDRLADELSETRRRLLQSQRRSLVLLVVCLAVAGGAAWVWVDGPRFGLRAAGAEPGTALAVSDSVSVSANDDERAALQAELDEQRTRADGFRAERNQFVGEVARLRSDLVRAEQRYAALTEQGLVVPMPVPVDAPGVSRTSDRSGPVDILAVNAAFDAASLRSVRLIEYVAAEDGVLHDVTLHRVDLATGERGIEQWASVALVSNAGALVLELDGGPVDSLQLGLNLADAPAFDGTPLKVPRALRRLAGARHALGELLVGQNLELVRLGGFAAGEFFDIELRETRLSLYGEPEVLRAERGRVLDVGPTLLLQGGTVTIDGIERPFYHGEYRRALPGADISAWERSLLEGS